MEENEYNIYKIYHPSKPDEYYIGRTEWEIEERFKGHLSDRESAIRKKFDKAYCREMKVELYYTICCTENDIRNIENNILYDLRPKLNRFIPKYKHNFATGRDEYD